MNKSERKFIDRIDAVIRTASTMTPSNPMDVSMLVANHRLIIPALKALTAAIGSFRAGDLDEVQEHLKTAEKLVEQPRL